MNKNSEALAHNRQLVSRKIIIGIDHAKDKHQVRIIDANGIPVGKSFSFR
ncbi:MAG: hypothetical protein IIA61_06115 [Candidatus Marinimicrobia bacterium]|nr:hypothetical protein [Candidatus Neomarinimicrobiota bacterium]